jgi:2'-hydroxyisoflavone reductase
MLLPLGGYGIIGGMRLLILGGTWFLGRTLAELALNEGWQVTTFSRGRGGRDVPGTRALRGDRNDLDDVGRLPAEGPWDAVVDTSGFMPAVVAAAAEALHPVAGCYVYLSTVNVYRGWPKVPLADDSPVYSELPEVTVDMAGEAERQATAEQYGQLKAACERAVSQRFGPDGLIVRPGVILGPYEYNGRLPWLLRRMHRGGQVLAPGDPARPIQPVDVRDLAAFILTAISAGLRGAVNVTAPLGHSTYGEMLESCREVTGGTAELVWVADEWLSGQDVKPWREIPLWRIAAGTWQVSSARAWAAGLVCRPLPATVTDTWAWLGREEPVAHWRAREIGIDPDKERRLLAAWHRLASDGR